MIDFDMTAEIYSLGFFLFQWEIIKKTSRMVDDKKRKSYNVIGG